MKRLARNELNAAEAGRIGEELREARLALGISVEDAAHNLRINRRYLAALEEGRIRDLPAAAYAVGFVRSYSSALGLDPDEMVRRFREVTGNPAQKSSDLVFPEPVPRRGLPAGVLVGAGAVLVVAAYVAWYNWSGTGQRTVDTVPPLPPRLEATAQLGETLRDPEAAAPAPAPAPVIVAPPPPPPPPPRVTLRARGDTTVQIRDSRAGNEVILDRVVRSGETVPVPNRDGLVLTVGLAQNLEVLLDGQPTLALAGPPGPRRGLSLDADRLRPRPAATPQARPAAPPPPRPATPAPAPARPTTAPGATSAPTPAPVPTPAPPPGTFVPFTGAPSR